MERSRGGALDIWVVILTQFGISISFNFMVVFLPFYIASISRADRETTLLWVGALMSVAPVTAAIGAPLWGGLTERISPKRIIEKGLLSHTVMVGLVGFVSSLPLLFLVRVVHGFLGGISTIGMIVISSLSRPPDLPRYLGLYHSAITLGQIIGPPLGGFAAAALGYRAAFLASSAMLFVNFLLATWFIAPIPPQRREVGGGARPRPAALAGWGVGLIATVHLNFLPSVLPELLQGMGMRGDQALVSAGGVLMASGVAASLGALGLTRLTRWISADLLILLTGLAGSLALLAMSWSRDLPGFTALRMIETGCVAAIVPLLFSLFAGKGQGRTIGTLNASRFSGNALGPILATTILARGTPAILYGAIAGLTVMAVLVFLAARGPARLSTLASP